LNTGQLEYHVFITAINIPAHHRHLHHHMCTLQTSAVHQSHALSSRPPCFKALHLLLQPPCSAAAAEAVQRITGGCRTMQQWREPPRSAAAAAAA
jgi:hypothetical protein